MHQGVLPGAARLDTWLLAPSYEPSARERPTAMPVSASRTIRSATSAVQIAG